MPSLLFPRIAAALFALASPFMAAPAQASNTNGYGVITGVYGTYNGAVMFSVVGIDRSTPPTCGQRLSSRWAIDASTTAGQAAVAVLLSAWAARKQVWVTGTGTCSIWGDTETVMFFNVQD